MCVNNGAVGPNGSLNLLARGASDVIYLVGYLALTPHNGHCGGDSSEAPFFLAYSVDQPARNILLPIFLVDGIWMLSHELKFVSESP